MYLTLMEEQIQTTLLLLLGITRLFSQNNEADIVLLSVHTPVHVFFTCIHQTALHHHYTASIWTLSDALEQQRTVNVAQ